MQQGWEFKGWRLSLTRTDIATEDNEQTAVAVGDEQDATVLVVEGASDIVSSALPLIEKILGVPVRDPVVTYSRPDQDANRYEPTVEQDETGNDADGKPRRKRRTKAEIEADKLAEAAAIRRAAEAAMSPQASSTPVDVQNAIAPVLGTPPPGWSPFGTPASQA